MSRRPIVVALGALLLALRDAAPAQAQSSTQAQSSKQTPVMESENPINDQGSNYNYRSYVTHVAPSVPGVSLQVLEFADRLILTNHSGQTVTVLGYQGEPYGRVLADGTVQLNTRSPAYYLNQNFYGDVNVPASASPTRLPTGRSSIAPAAWNGTTIASTGCPRPCRRRSRTRQAHEDLQLAGADRGGRSEGHGQRRALLDPRGGTKAPAAAILVLVALVVLGLLFVLFVRRRRSGTAAGGSATIDESAQPTSDDRPTKEAW